MKMFLAIAPIWFLSLSATAFAQTNLASYCQEMTKVSTTTLLARSQGVSRLEAEGQMQGMTDPVAIRMVKELLEFAYSHPATTSVDAMQTELRNRCLAKKIFVQ